MYFGVSASELRNNGRGFSNGDHDSKIGKLYRKYGKAFNLQDFYSQFVIHEVIFEPDKLKEMLVKVNVEDIRVKQLAYLTSPKGYDLDSVYATWDKVMDWASSKGIEKDRQTYFAVCHDNPTITPEDKCRYDVAMVIDADVQVTAPFTPSVFPAGHYAIAYYKGDGDKISNFMTEPCSH